MPENHRYLIERAKKWLLNKNYPTVITEYRSYASETPDVMGFGNDCTMVIECKVSRSDFLHDLKKHHRHDRHAIGNYRYYLTLPGIINKYDVPESWGLLYATDKRIVKIVPAPRHDTLEIRAEEWRIMYSLVRRVVGHGLLEEILKPF